MSDTKEQMNSTETGNPRQPVVWKIARVKEENRTVTVVFPVVPEKNEFGVKENDLNK